jgi:hypothetical protein
MKSVIYGTFVVWAATAFLCLAAPEPAIIPGPGDWTMEVTFEHPQQIIVQMEKSGLKRFWYTIVTLTNQSGQDVGFYPTCDLMTDTFHIIPANKQPLLTIRCLKMQQVSRSRSTCEKHLKSVTP